MMMRRRPLARAAIVGGVAYSAGKSRQRAAYAEDEQNARMDALEQQQYAQQQQQYAAPPPPAAAPAAPASDPDEIYAQLEKLADLKSKGILTDAEFEVQKAKLLGQT
jgi:type II secretory pathway pseudopilin PulG